MSARGWLLYVATLMLTLIAYSSTISKPSPSNQPMKVSRRAKASTVERKKLTPQQYFDQSDKDHDGKISLVEWIGQFPKEMAARRKLMFLAADKNRDGYWTLQEWKGRGKARNPKKK